jgi:hypothetical protein
VAEPARADLRRGALVGPAGHRRARTCAGRRDAPARGQGARRPGPRTPHRPSSLRAPSRPRGARADRGDQLLVRCTQLPPSSAFGRGWSSSPTTASTRSRPGGDASASTAYASGTSSSRARWSRPSERPDSASRPARSTTPQCSSRSCRLASTPSQATPRSSQARAVSRPRMKGTLAANMLVGHG